MATARLGIGFSGGPTASEIVDCVRLAESLGYESAWVAEGHGGDQFAVLSGCAAATSTILLGTAITSVYVRSIPTILFFKGGEHVDTVIGAVPKAQLQQKIEEHL